MKKISSPKRVLITAYDFPPQTGGVSTYSLEFALSLKKLGYHVLVVTKKRTSLPLGLNIDIISVDLPNQGILSFPILALKLRSIIKNFKPDHIFCTLWMPGASSTYLSLKFLTKKIPYTIIVHAMEIIESKESLKKRLRSALSPLKKRIFSSAQSCICISEFTKKKVLDLKLCSPKKIHVVHNGVNPSKFKISEKNKKNSFPHLLTVARLVPHKGIDTVLHSLPTIINRHPEVIYSIAGHGPDSGRLKKIVSDLSIERNVEFLGKVEDSQLSQLYSQSDLFILLSREEKHQVEGFGLVILEAAACRTPALGARSGGIPDAIIEGKTGWLVSPHDVNEISSTLLSILENPDDLNSTGEYAYSYTLEQRTWEHVTKNILSKTGLFQ